MLLIIVPNALANNLKWLWQYQPQSPPSSPQSPPRQTAKCWEKSQAMRFPPYITAPYIHSKWKYIFNTNRYFAICSNLRSMRWEQAKKRTSFRLVLNACSFPKIYSYDSDKRRQDYLFQTDTIKSLRVSLPNTIENHLFYAHHSKRLVKIKQNNIFVSSDK